MVRLAGRGESQGSLSGALLLLGLGLLAGSALAGELWRTDECQGRRVWIHELPSEFNRELLYNESRDNALPWEWYSGAMIKHLSKASENLGFGKPMPSIMGVEALQGAWFNTDHNTLENIFFFRMLSFRCRVPAHERAAADLVYVPYFGAHDSLRNMHRSIEERDRIPDALLRFLTTHEAWAKRNGTDHFWVLGSPIWDFYRNQWSSWGSKLLLMDGVRDNIWTVLTERAWGQPRIASSPQPTGFHPATRNQLQAWQEFVARQERPHLLAFAGGHRGRTSAEGILREKLFWQCAQAEQKGESCKLLDCNREGVNCLDPNAFFGLYLSASFCLHPIGDSCTRRSLVDAALAGCIPVTFKDCTLKNQFEWHLRGLKVSPERLMVYIPAESVRGEQDPPAEGSSESNFAPNSVLVEDILRKIPASEVEAMRSNVIDLIPLVTYGGRVEGDAIVPPDFRDAVDVIVDGVAEEINRKGG